MELHVPLPSAATAAREARVAVRAALADWNIAHCLDDALLVASELVTNAVRHGSGPITLHLRTTDSELRVAVQDRLPLAGPRPLHLSSAEPSGRGLLIVAATSRKWGWDADEESKTVWADLDCTPPASATA